MSRLRLDGASVWVGCGEDGQPAAVQWCGRRQRVCAVLNRWRVETGWWDVPVQRAYYKVLLEDGCALLLALDGDRWFVRRIYG